MVKITKKEEFELKKLYKYDMIGFLERLKNIFKSCPIIYTQINKTLKNYNYFLNNKTKINKRVYLETLKELFELLNIVKNNKSIYGILFLPPYKVVEKEHTPTLLCSIKIYWYLVYDEQGKRLCTFELREKHNIEDILIKYELNQEDNNLPF